MKLSKFVEIAGIALSLASAAAEYGDIRIINLCCDIYGKGLRDAYQQAIESFEKNEAFEYYIQDIGTLMGFVENRDFFVEGVCKVKECCLWHLLTGKDTDTIKCREMIKSIDINAMPSGEIQSFIRALQGLIFKNENRQPYISDPDWEEFTAHYGEIYVTASGDIMFINSAIEDAKLKEMMSDPDFALRVHLQETTRRTASQPPSAPISRGTSSDCNSLKESTSVPDVDGIRRQEKTLLCQEPSISDSELESLFPGATE